ncbi:MAG TPA: 16S rRNA (cytosine(967)-C(5))-methyltransferase RsmB [Gammaproteobacteria bacterium]|nr:16S rRNA (cytosine(967)-C(5))-methyltransferase RsmB [Gammaproteobacteria bacterium]
MQAPMVLRVNQQKISCDKYLQRLTECDIAADRLSHAADGVVLKQAVDVHLLPGFDDGLVSVQDAAAQQAAALLGHSKHSYVLDACAAPGGKTAHLLETQPDAKVLALDVSEGRLLLIKDTLTRLSLFADVKCADAAVLDDWWDGRKFDSILLDAPCSATGVIRRNPDIKIHRRLKDIHGIIVEQRRLLEQLWQTLKPGGHLLYATCSILKDENENQIRKFLDSHNDAVEQEINTAWGRKCKAGVQVLPGDQLMDGFYYARLEKTQ